MQSTPQKRKALSLLLDLNHKTSSRDVIPTASSLHGLGTHQDRGNADVNPKFFLLPACEGPPLMKSISQVPSTAHGQETSA